MGEFLPEALNSEAYKEWQAKTCFFEFARELANRDTLSPHLTPGEKFDVLLESQSGEMLSLPGQHIGRNLHVKNRDTLFLIRPLEIPPSPLDVIVKVELLEPDASDSPDFIRQCQISFLFFYGTERKLGMQELGVFIDGTGDMYLSHRMALQYQGAIVFDDNQTRELDVPELESFLEKASIISGLPVPG